MFLLRRRTELFLLVIAFALVAVGSYALQLQIGSAYDPTLMPILAAFFFVTHFYLALVRPAADEIMLPVVALISGIGVIFVTRLEPDLAQTQVTWIGLGLVLMSAAMLILPNPI